jgi:hypothetical protein
LAHREREVDEDAGQRAVGQCALRNKRAFVHSGAICLVELGRPDAAHGSGGTAERVSCQLNCELRRSSIALGDRGALGGTRNARDRPERRGVRITDASNAQAIARKRSRMRSAWVGRAASST